MNKSRTVIGAHAFFFPDGAAFTVPAPGVVARETKTGNADPAWFDFGVSDWNFASTGQVEDFFAPAPGRRVLWDRITTRAGLKLKGKLMEMSNPVWGLLLQAAQAEFPNAGAGGQYNPLEGEPVLRGWLQLQQYTQLNALLNTMDVFVAMQIPGDVQFGDKPVDIDVEADVLFSTLNTGTLA
jgi:hypothetical protein